MALIARGGRDGGRPLRLDDPALDAALPDGVAATLRDGVEMARVLCKPLNITSYREGHLSPIFFGSAVNNFGVKELLDGLADMAPPPRPQPTTERAIGP